jgi:TPR repeat protein
MMDIDYYNAGMNAYAGERYREAYEWLIQGTDDPRCDYALGVLFYNGQGVERDFKRAVEHYSRAAEAGVVPAQVSAGFAYANALGVPEDFDKAARYLRMAASAGEPAAKITLAEIYAKGHAGGTRKEAAALIREVLSSGSSEEAMEIYSRYELHKA